jgi:predicted RNA-binding protein with PIN domain
MNVIGSRPDGWWRDRDAAKRRLVDALDGYAKGSNEETIVFLDGAPIELPSLERVEVRFAPGGPNAADQAITEHVRASADSAELRVVTSDAALAADVRALGAEVVPSGGFRRQLDGS